jgi:hypothetical protein
MATNGAAHDEQGGGNAYNLFILVLTLISLLVMVLMWLPLSSETIDLLRVYDNIICIIFLIDFALSLSRHERAIPSLCRRDRLCDRRRTTTLQDGLSRCNGPNYWCRPRWSFEIPDVALI